MVIIIAGFLILASGLTAVESCRSSCRFGNAAGHRLLQSSANSQLLYPGDGVGGRSFWETSTPCAKIEWKPSGLEKMARWVSRYQREQWLLVTGTAVTLHRALFPPFLHSSPRRPAALPPGVGQGSKKQRGKNRKIDWLANCGGWVLAALLARLLWRTPLLLPNKILLAPHGMAWQRCALVACPT
jgi:hypothetical protein